MSNTSQLAYYSDEKQEYEAGIEVLTTVTMKSIVFLDVTPYSAVELQYRFYGTDCLDNQSRRRSGPRRRKQQFLPH
jgi:hypothetical protein